MKSPSTRAGGRPGIRGLNPLEISERLVGLTFVRQPGPGPFPFETLGPIWPAMGVRHGPKVPTMPPFSYRGGKSSQTRKMSKVDRRIMGNSLLLMTLNFQCEFYNFYAIALDVIEPLG